MWNNRRTGNAVLSCQVRQAIQRPSGRIRNRPCAAASSDPVRGLPTTFIKRRYCTAAAGRPTRSASVTGGPAGIACVMDATRRTKARGYATELRWTSEAVLLMESPVICRLPSAPGVASASRRLPGDRLEPAAATARRAARRSPATGARRRPGCGHRLRRRAGPAVCRGPTRVSAHHPSPSPTMIAACMVPNLRTNTVVQPGAKGPSNKGLRPFRRRCAGARRS